MGYTDEETRQAEKVMREREYTGTDEPMRELPPFTRLERFDEAQERINEWTTSNDTAERANLGGTTLDELVRMLHTAEGLAIEHRQRANRIDAFVERIRERMHVAANETAQDAVRGAEVRDYR